MDAETQEAVDSITLHVNEKDEEPEPPPTPGKDFYDEKKTYDSDSDSDSVKDVRRIKSSVTVVREQQSTHFNLLSPKKVLWKNEGIQCPVTSCRCSNHLFNHQCNFTRHWLEDHKEQLHFFVCRECPETNQYRSKRMNDLKKHLSHSHKLILPGNKAPSRSFYKKYFQNPTYNSPKGLHYSPAGYKTSQKFSKEASASYGSLPKRVMKEITVEELNRMPIMAEEEDPIPKKIRKLDSELAIQSDRKFRPLTELLPERPKERKELCQYILKLTTLSLQLKTELEESKK